MVVSHALKLIYNNLSGLRAKKRRKKIKKSI